MIKCRLKIISSNIINGIDTPQIMYVSQNDIPKIIINNNEDNYISETKDNNLINNNELEKINSEHNSENNSEHKSEHNNENIESNNINNNDNNDNNYEQMEQIEEYINKQISNYIQVENNNSQLNEIKNINSNELYTISNQHIYDDNCFSPKVKNRNTVSHFTKNETNYNSSNQSDVKKNQSKKKFVKDFNEVKGLVPLRYIRAGSPVTKGYFQTPIVVEYNQPIRIITRYHGVEAAAKGIALGRGRIGQIIRVKNEMSEKIVSARVLNAQTAEVVL